MYMLQDMRVLSNNELSYGYTSKKLERMDKLTSVEVASYDVQIQGHLTSVAPTDSFSLNTYI